MRIADVLKFKSPHRVDWPATQKAVNAAVHAENTGVPSLAVDALNAASVMNDIRRVIRKYGVARLYRAQQPEKSADRQQAA